MPTTCFNCNQPGHEFHGYIICEGCKKDLRLFTDKTVARHVAKFTQEGYANEIKSRLAAIDKEVIKKKIKLLDILSKLGG